LHTHRADPASPAPFATRAVRRLVVALTCAAAASVSGCVKQPDAKTCPTGIYCPAGSECAARQAVCIFTPCGNGKLDPGEACDDGNVVDGDGCNATCTSNETCGNGFKDLSEECDFALTPDTCTTTCTSNICGNTRTDPGEDCDPGPGGMTAQCLATCRWSRCGDTVVNPLAGEGCDDGNLDNQDDCTNSCKTNFCGDGNRQLRGSRIEGCDEGEGNVASLVGLSCGYGQVCTFCLQGSCTVGAVIGPRCGDGIRQGLYGEECDDARSAACGTCAACGWVDPRAAQGSIDVVNATSIVAGDTITIDDGTSLAVLEFSNTFGNCATPGAHCVDIQGRGANGAVAAQLRFVMSPANGWTSDVTPSGSGNPVSLVHARSGVSFNVAIVVHGSSVAVSPASGAVVVHGMAGGVGCRAGDACSVARDCVWPLSCSSGTCQ
jgi:cysteine-rich repeat protein